jgi:hypothetical protein
MSINSDLTRGVCVSYTNEARDADAAPTQTGK